MYRQILRETLQDRYPSFDISEAVNGEDALKKIAAVPPDLVGVARPHDVLHAIRYGRCGAAWFELAADVPGGGHGHQRDERAR